MNRKTVIAGVAGVIGIGVVVLQVLGVDTSWCTPPAVQEVPAPPAVAQ